MAEEETDIRQIERELADELLRLHTESYGKGAEAARVHLIDDLVVCLLDGVELLPNERFLIESGEEQGVLEVRARYQQAIESTFSAAVERATGRRVVSFTSQTKLDPDYSVEIFRLAPRQPPPREMA